MPTLNQLIEEARKPEIWYPDVLEEVVKDLKANIHKFVSGSGFDSHVVWVDKPVSLSNHMARLARYLADELDAEVEPVIESQYNQSIYGFRIRRKGSSLAQAYWDR